MSREELPFEHLAQHSSLKLFFILQNQYNRVLNEFFDFQEYERKL